MNKITIHFTLTSLFITSIWYAPATHSAAARALQVTSQTIASLYLSAATASISATPELRTHGLTEQNLAPFTNLVTRTRPHLAQPDFDQLINLISEVLIRRNLSTEKKEQHAVTCGLLAVANYMIEDLYKQIEQLDEQSDATPRELTTSQQLEQTTANPSNPEASTLALMEQITTKRRKLATFKENTQDAIQTAKQELLAAQQHQQATSQTLTRKIAELALIQQQLATSEHESATFMEHARLELLAAQRREQTLAEELTATKAELTSTQQRLEDFTARPCIMLPLYALTNEGQLASAADHTV